MNVENDLEPFSWIVPCGLEGVTITSIARETGRAGDLDRFRTRMAEEFARSPSRATRHRRSRRSGSTQALAVAAGG